MKQPVKKFRFKVTSSVERRKRVKNIAGKEEELPGKGVMHRRTTIETLSFIGSREFRAFPQKVIWVFQLECWLAQ
jgi:hypothetical protein